MKWRRVPPVSSPIAPHSLLAAAAAALGPSRPADALERRIADLFAAQATVLTDSGTSALVLALEASVGPEALIALPGYACIDVIAAAIGARVKAILYDVDPETLSPDLDSVRSALRAGARGLVVAPLYGYPPDMDSLLALAAEHGAVLIEDAAQGAGGLLHSKRVGAFGDLSVLSFGRGKGTTGGSGGALLVRKAGLLDWARGARAGLRPHRGARELVALAAQWILARPSLYSIPSNIPALQLGEMVYHPARQPRALSASAAAVIPTALALDPAEIRARRARAASLLAAASQSRRFAPIRALPGAEPGFLRLAVLDTTASAAPDPHLGAVRGYPIALDEHAESRRVLTGGARALPGARTLRDRLYTLPTHSRVGPSDEARLREWLTAGPALTSPREANASV